MREPTPARKLAQAEAASEDRAALLDYFAAAALTGLAAAFGTPVHEKNLAEASYKVAAAMMDARARFHASRP